MATLRDIKTRLGSIQKTRLITSALKVVASTKLKKAQDRYLKMRVAADGLRVILAEAVAGADAEFLPPALLPRTTGRVGVAVVTSDRGLCGGFNTAVVKRSLEVLNTIRDEGKEACHRGVGGDGGV